MRTTGFIAGGLGVTVVVGLLGLITLVGAVGLVLRAPGPAAEPDVVRAAVAEQQAELAWCAAGTDGGTLTATVVLRRGEPVHVGVIEARMDPQAARCIAESLAAATWPDVTTSARVPITLTP